MISRRRWLAGVGGGVSGFLGGCGPRLAKPFAGYCFAANRAGATLAAVDLTQFRVAKQIPLGGRPSAVLAETDGAALVLLPESGTVARVTVAGLSVAQRSTLGAQATGMKLNREARSLWVLMNDPPALVRLDLKGWRAAKPIALADAARDFDVAPNGGLAAVLHAERKECRLLALPGGGVLHKVTLASTPSLVRFRPDGKQLLIASAAGRTVSVVDCALGTVSVILPMPFAPERFCFSVDGGQLFTTGAGMDAVAILYPYQTEVAETVLAGRGPGAMAVNDTLLFVTNPPTGDTTVIAIAERQVVARIPSGENPCAVTLTPDGEYALVLNNKSGDMAVVRLSKLTDLRYKRAPLFTVIPVGEDPVSAAVVAV